MKKLLKIITFILSLVLLCSVFTGCNMLDNLKEAHALINEEKTIITYKGNTYLPIEETHPYFNPLTEQNINVTEKDVPVLLSQSYNVYVGEITDDGSVMSLNTFYWSAEYTDNVYFCREDRYDEIVKMQQQDPIFDTYYYSYFGYNDEDKYVDENYIFTDEQREAVGKIMTTVEPAYTSTNEYIADSHIFVVEATKDMVFRHERLFIYKNGGKYIIEDYDDSNACYIVPEEYNEIFDEIMVAANSVD